MRKVLILGAVLGLFLSGIVSPSEGQEEGDRAAIVQEIKRHKEAIRAEKKTWPSSKKRDGRRRRVCRGIW